MLDLHSVAQATVRAWAHTHKWDRSEMDFDMDMVSSCETCTTRHEEAVDRGELCAKHPMAYFEKGRNGNADLCEGCDRADLEGDR